VLKHLTIAKPGNSLTIDVVSQQIHIPVLYQETLEALDLQPGGRYIDATLGGGGHAEGILSATLPNGVLLGLDASPNALTRTSKRLAQFGERVTLVHSNFRNLKQIATEHGFSPADGILLDLGLSSHQLDDPTQGFSFQEEGPLDMRLDFTQGETAAEVINRLDATELANILYQYGEERQSRRIARSIGAARPIYTTAQLANVITHSRP